MKKLLLYVTIAFALASCSSYKSVPYFKDVEQLKVDAPIEDAVIKPNDILSIVVSSVNPKAVATYNLTAATVLSEQPNNYLSTQPTLQNYLVDKDGEINFPALGVMKVSGMTKKRLEESITKKLMEVLTDKPIVTIRIINYRFSVLGEVNTPKTFTVANEKVNILEAIAMAGDLTIYGRRDNVKLIRENSEGKREVVTLNLNKSDIFTSPYYNLQQNDIIYVTPNKAKAKNSDVGNSTGLWFSATSILVSLASLIINILK